MHTKIHTYTHTCNRYHRVVVAQLRNAKARDANRTRSDGAANASTKHTHIIDITHGRHRHKSNSSIGTSARGLGRREMLVVVAQLRNAKARDANRTRSDGAAALAGLQVTPTWHPVAVVLHVVVNVDVLPETVVVPSLALRASQIVEVEQEVVEVSALTPEALAFDLIVWQMGVAVGQSVETAATATPAHGSAASSKTDPTARRSKRCMLVVLVVLTR